MATTPNDPSRPSPSSSSKADDQRTREQQVLMREVDEAVRTDEALNAWRQYGKPLVAGVVLGLLAFGGYLYWQSRQEAALEQQSEALVQAMDELTAGNIDVADRELAAIGDNPDSSPAARSSANMLRAAIALEQDRKPAAVAFYDRVANDEDAPPPMRNASLVRLVSASYDTMDKQQVIDRLHTLATPGNPWFGSAAELVAHAYLDQNKPDLAGPLLVQIAKDETVPDTIRARTRQLAGRYGFDAIDDVNELLGDAPPADSAGANGEAGAAPAPEPVAAAPAQ
ncbi:MAG: tetratricopeptide repeat protein [Alteraurantiacibacter sp.]